MYEKHNWVNGEVITEDKLNHMEDGISTGGGIYTYGEVPLFDGEVTTVSNGVIAEEDITLQGELPKSDISVTFNGQNYTLPYGNGASGDCWGELDSSNMPSFTNYPLFIGVSGGGYMVATPEAGTYSLKVNETVGKFTVNDVFKENMVVTVNGSLEEEGANITLNKTYNEIFSALNSGKHIDFLHYDSDNGIYTQLYLEEALVNINEVSLLCIDTASSSLSWKHLVFQYKTDGYPSTNNGVDP